MSPQITFIGFKDISTREQLILELNTSNKLLSSIIEFYPDATLIIDNAGKVIAWNKAIEEMTGVKAADMIGKGDYEYAIPFYGQRKPLLLNILDVPPAEINERYKDVRIHNGKLEALAVKAKIKSEDAIIWANACKLYDADGKVVGAIESIRDVTGQKKAEEARRESEQRLADIIDFLPDATFAIDRDGKVVAWNRAIEELTGIKVKDILGKGDYAYAVPFYGTRRPILIDLVFRFDKEIEKKYAYVKKEGDALLAETDWLSGDKIRVLWGKAVPFYDNKGNIVGAIESMRDITDRKQTLEELKIHRDHLEELVAERTADLSEVNGELQKEIAERRQVEEELSKNEKFLKNMFECIQDGITILDNDMNIIRINRTIENRFPHMRPIIGKKCYYAYHDRSEPCENCPCIKAIKEKTPQNGVVPFNGPNGIVRGWMELYAFPLFDNDGNVVGVIEHSRDITGRRRSEEALKEAKAEAELYLDLMGHDINNLNQIGLGFLEMALEMPGLDDKARSLLSRPLAALVNSSRLIDNVRKLQKARSGELQRGEIDIGQTLSDVQANYSRVPGGDITINYTPVSGCTVMANELLDDVFSNLVGNAIKHSDKKPVISIRLDKEPIGGKLHYRVAVEDNGPGISDELKPRIFNRHLRGSTKAKGSGIGLYLVKTLVESYGGRVWVEDRIAGNRSEGSRFVVMLPACEIPK
jgi:PAS domain S-box-containing protein